MSRELPPHSPEVSALLEHEREIPPLPATVRARAMARARAALVAGVARRPTPVPMPVPGRGWAAAAAVLCILGGAVGAGAYQLRAYLAPRPLIQPLPAPVENVVKASARRVVAEPIAEPDLLPQPTPVAEKPALSKADAARAELRLLRQARAAVAREDYAAALPPIAEHAHRFKSGRLTEEREALRVKALAGLGRTDEARRAATAFRARFPRSVLLSAVNQMSPSEP